MLGAPVERDANGVTTAPSGVSTRIRRISRSLGVISHEQAVAIFIAVAITLRLVLDAMGWPLLNSDEGTMGLMAIHIARAGERPIFFYGQNYMGALEAYIAAALFKVFGDSLFALRLAIILLFGLFLVSLYVLARLLYSKPIALLTVAVLSFGSDDLVRREMKADGGYMETLLFGTLLLVLSVLLARGYMRPPTILARLWRLAGYAAWGLVAGLGLWSDLLILPFIVVAGGLLVWFCWRDILSLFPFALLFGFFIGAFPLIKYNRHALPGKDSLHVFESLMSTGGTGQIGVHTSLLHQIIGTVFVSLPIGTGAGPLCPLPSPDLNPTAPEPQPFAPGTSKYALTCTVVHGVWGIGVVILGALALVVAALALWRAYRDGSAARHAVLRRECVVQYAGRLAVLGVAAMVVVAYVHSPAPALVPWASDRYLIGVIVAAPAVLALLWERVSGAIKTPRATRIACRAALAVICLAYFIGPVDTILRVVPPVQAVNAQQTALIAELPHLHATRIYTDYWTCGRLMFLSDENIVCEVVISNLQPGFNRYPPYEAIVQHSAQQPTYVVPIGSLQDATLMRQMASGTAHYHRTVLAGYAMYR